MGVAAEVVEEKLVVEKVVEEKVVGETAVEMVFLHFMVVVENGVELFMIVVIHCNENRPISGVSVAAKGRVLCQRPQMEGVLYTGRGSRLTVGRSGGRTEWR